MTFNIRLTSLKSAISDFGNQVQQKLIPFKGKENEILIFDQTNVVSAMKSTKMCIPMRAITNDTDLDLAKGQIQSFQEIFDNWKRISISGNTNFPAIPAELDGWSYENDLLQSTINSTSLIGFIDPDSFTDYVFEASLKSTSADDDLIGLCLGFFEDTDGKQYTLTATRTPGGMSPKLFSVLYNYSQPTTIDLGSTNGNLEWGDGIVDDSRIMNTVYSGGGWAAKSDGCRIKATRQGDIITLETTNLNSQTYVETAKVIVDLNSRPELAKFRGESQIGYVCLSQANSFFEIHSRPNKRLDIIDIRTMVLWRWNNATLSWDDMGDTRVNNLIQRGVFYWDTMQGRNLFCTDEGEFTIVGSPGLATF